MYESISMLFRQLVSLCACFIIYISVKYNFCAISFGTVYLDQRRGCRHYNCSFRAITLRSISNALRMVARRGGDNAFCTLFLGQSAHLIISASYLVCTGELQVFRLKKYLCTGLLAEIITVYKFCLQRYSAHYFGSLFKFFQCQHLFFFHFSKPYPSLYQTVHSQTDPDQTSADPRFSPRHRYILPVRAVPTELLPQYRPWRFHPFWSG